MIESHLALNTLTSSKEVQINKVLLEQNNREQSEAPIVSAPDSLGKEDFLRLLVTQLTYQDPTAPVEDKEFIAQIAQFSSLEQMQNVSRSIRELTSNQSAHLLGYEISGTNHLGDHVQGVVEKISFDNDGDSHIWLHVNGTVIDPKQVDQIIQPSVRNSQDFYNHSNTQKEGIGKNLNIEQE